MDRSVDLEALLNQIKELDFNNVFEFVNKLDKAVYSTACTHIAIKTHNMPNRPNAQNINDQNIIEIKSFQNTAYF